MDTNKAREYLDKKIKLFLKNGYKFEGKVLEVNKGVLILNDWRSGKTTIDISSVSVIFENGR